MSRLTAHFLLKSLSSRSKLGNAQPPGASLPGFLQLLHQLSPPAPAWQQSATPSTGRQFSSQAGSSSSQASASSTGTSPSSTASPSSPAAAPPAADAIHRSAARFAAAAAASSLDPREAAKFAVLADKWWDAADGPFAPLHALSAARCRFVRRGVCRLRGLQGSVGEPLVGMQVLDVGCGGGLLSEPVARLGASVHGIDVAAEGVAAAAAHAAGDPLLVARIRYQQTTLEDLLASGGSSCYDVVMASEVIEHVRRPQHFMQGLAAAAVPGGQVFVTTLNRTPTSFALAVVGAEYVLRLVPRGTHSWEKFITPQELAMMGQDAGLRLELMAGMVMNPLTGQFRLDAANTSINYAALFSKPGRQ